MPSSQKSKTQALVGEVVDRKARAAEPAPDVPVKPQGSPDLIPWHLTTRRQKAGFGPVMDKVQALDDAGKAADRMFELSMTLGADVEDALAGMALNAVEAKAWLRAASEEDLMALFGWYMSQVKDDQGEATASRS